MALPRQFAAAAPAATRKEKQIEVKFSISDTWSRQLFIALCRRSAISLRSLNAWTPTCTTWTDTAGILPQVVLKITET